jgi:hypothetical protein
LLRLSNARDHLHAGANAKAIHWVHTPGVRGRCIASLGDMAALRLLCE